MKTRLPFLLMTWLLAGCAAAPFGRQADLAPVRDDPEQTIERLSAAIRENPEALEYRTQLASAVDRFVASQVALGQSALQAGNRAAAVSHFQAALRRHPENPQARAGLEAVEVARRNEASMIEAESAYKKGDYDKARKLLRSILALAPDHAEASLLLAKAEQKIGKPHGLEFPQLAEAFRRPVTLQFKDAPIKSMFDAISRQGGLNFILDKDVKADQRSSVFAQDAALADVLDMLLASNQLGKKVLNANTLLIYPATTAKLKEYQDMVVKSFFLSHANAKDVMAMLRTLIKTKDIHVDERLNLVVVRDAPEGVALAEKLVNMIDRPEAEVMLQVEIMEVGGSKLQELGLQWPTQLGVLSLKDIDTVTTNNGTTVATTKSQQAQQLTLEMLRSLDDSKVGVYPNPALNLLRTDGDVKILANPRIRVKNKEKARIHIGDKVPVITSNVTSTGVTSESVSYLDVGLKLDVESLVRLDGDVEMKVGLEVSSIANTIKTNNGSVVYQLGSRNASTVLRLRDGETQILAGLISDAERSSVNKVPGLGSLPLLGRLFSSNRDESSKTEVVLLITPRILRNIARPELAELEFFAGTERTVTDQPMRIRPAAAPDRVEEAPAQDAPGDAGVAPASGAADPAAAQGGSAAVPGGPASAGATGFAPSSSGQATRPSWGGMPSPGAAPAPAASEQ